MALMKLLIFSTTRAITDIFNTFDENGIHLKKSKYLLFIFVFGAFSIRKNM